jgi:hypothetical protein
VGARPPRSYQATLVSPGRDGGRHDAWLSAAISDTQRKSQPAATTIGLMVSESDHDPKPHTELSVAVVARQVVTSGMADLSGIKWSGADCCANHAAAFKLRAIVHIDGCDLLREKEGRRCLYVEALLRLFMAHTLGVQAGSAQAASSSFIWVEQGIEWRLSNGPVETRFEREAEPPINSVAGLRIMPNVTQDCARSL